jgi:succinate dehydrogenase/fumarate reductase flavoprotein subunit
MAEEPAYGLPSAFELGHQIAYISKLFPTRSHTFAAQGVINAALRNMNGNGMLMTRL